MRGNIVDLLEPRAPDPLPPILTLGFRPMFLLAACHAALAVPVFLLAWFAVWPIAQTIAPAFWHAHEMLFGFSAAVLAGFLLTAVPNWTGMAPIRGFPLLALAGLWIAGRLGFFFAGVLPQLLVSAVDLAFLPALAVAIAPSIIGARNRRNYVFFLLIGALVLANAGMHAELVGVGLPDLLDAGRRGQFLAVDGLILLIVIVGGRIVPAFTGNYLRIVALREGRTPQAISSRPLLDRLAIGLAAAVAITDLALGDRDFVLGVACLAAGGANLVRLAGWSGWKVRTEPILFVLHVGYGWLVLGLILRGLDICFGAFAGAAGVHALTIGAIGTMTMAVMARAALGHSGRAMKAPASLLIAIGSISMAAILRLAGAVSEPYAFADAMLIASAGAWSGAFALFAVILLPMVFSPRADGLPG